MNPTNEQIIEYLKELLDYLDGRGIIAVDDGLIDKSLKACGDFGMMREMFNNPIPQSER